MATQVGVAITATLEHRKAQSTCCAAPLDRVTPEGPERTCRQCGQPTEKVYAEPTQHTATGSGVMTAPAAEGSEG